MSIEDDLEKKRRRKEQDTSELTKGTMTSLRTLAPNQVANEVKFDSFVQRAQTLIDQLSHLYNMYFAGVEQRLPLEKRTLLDQIMAQLQHMNKPTSATLFRFGTIQSTYLTHREHWDKKIKDLERGKLKRLVGPQRFKK